MMHLLINFNVIGRPDGLGNRIEEIILIEAHCAKTGQLANYVWNNKVTNRSYEIKVTSKNVRISKDIYKDSPIKSINELELDLFTREEVLKSAKNIKPIFSIYFLNNKKPIGVHIRGTDRIRDNNHPHFMESEEEFISYLSKTISVINKKNPNYIFVCADSSKIREIFIENLNKTITVLNPIYEGDLKEEYIDFFALSLCKEIYMCSKFSSFSITASMIGNIPLIAFKVDKNVAERYKTLFKYELNIPHNSELNRAITNSFSGQRYRNVDVIKRLMKKWKAILKQILGLSQKS